MFVSDNLALIRHRKDGKSIGERFLSIPDWKQTLISNDLILNTSDPRKRGQGKKCWIRIPSDALDALLSKLKVNPTLYAYEMAEFLHKSGFGAFTVS